ncbi:hypothetical protein Angca_007439, partial [Angiostrongylus cantonensis]
GVLFSIEVTTMYFSVRSYWRGFFAACCGAITIRLLRGFVVQTEVTVNAFFQTSFAPDAFVVNEIPLFIVLGIFCGGMGAMYISLYRRVVLFLRNNKYAKKVFQQHWIVYPVFVSLIFSIISFPHGLGRFSTGRLKFGMNLRDFFSNCTFTEPTASPLSCKSDIFDHWLDNRGNILVLLALFITVHFVFSIVCMTLPVPSGVFMPIFVLGAAIGRLMGEIVAIALPLGLIEGINIYPGVYAVVGAASFSASVTHTVSVSVMIFEITGQLHYILPVMISVLLSNAVCAYMQPSFFDTIIKIKHLPFLPDIPPSNNIVHTICAENIMVSPVLFITKITTYADIRQILLDGRNLRTFPVVDSAASQMLIGTVSRNYLLGLLDAQIGEVARREEAERRVRRAIQTIDMHFQISRKEVGKNPGYNCKENDYIEYAHTYIHACIHTHIHIYMYINTYIHICNNLRFTVSIGKKIEPYPRTPRRNSLTRRNAFCSLEEYKVVSGENGPHKHHLTLHGIADYHTLVKSYMKQAKKCLHHMQFGHSKQEKPAINMYDLSQDERKEWETARLNEEADLTNDIDPAPFQLVKRTSLFKIHSIFSMLQLSKVYVTEGGRLIGVVSLNDVRHGLERSQERVSKADILSSQITAEQNLKPVFPKHSSSPVVDILTPTLEVVNSETLPLTADHETTGLESRPQSPQTSLAQARQKNSSTYLMGIIESEKSIFHDGQRRSLDEQRHEELVEAVAYLRRKSLAPERRFSKLQKH